MLVDWIFTFFFTKLHMLGAIGAIYGVSIAINFLALPLYNIADALQEKEKKISKSLEYRVKRIKKAFKGDEQFMMLSEYYRQNNYHPLYVLRSSLSILIEIPFFIAAYHYLSHASYLKNAVFWVFSDLSAPDALFSINIGSIALTINVLPIIMTIINFISGYIYTKDSTLRDKIQLYAMGIFFLVILYDSPSGLVIYWILNNIFSLVKTIILKTKNPKKVAHIVVSILLYCLFAFLFNVKRNYAYTVLVFALIFTIYPFIKKLIANKRAYKTEDKRNINYLPLLLSSGIGLTLLCGFLLPASTIATSPIEFSFIGDTASPASYVWKSLAVFSGLFLFWPFCIYKMFGDNVKKGESLLFSFVFICALANAFVFSGNYGLLNTQFFLEDTSLLQNISILNKIGPIAIALICIVIINLLIKANKASILSFAFLSLSIAEACFGLIKISRINKIFNDYTDSKTIIREDIKESGIEPVYHLTKTGKNVVVLFLDRAINSFLPYALKDIPELKDELDGFTYYPNTISFSDNTVTGSPAMMAGYEYTFEKLNERASEYLVDKHNEASLVAPTLFSNAGFNVTITDPPFPNYSWSGDLSAFKGLKNCNVTEIKGAYANKYANEIEYADNGSADDLTSKESRNFAVMQCLPPIARPWFNESLRSADSILSNEIQSFFNSFSGLYYLKDLSDFETETDQYIFIGNETTHEPMYLDESYTIPTRKDASAAIAYPTEDSLVFMHYQSFVAAMKQTGIWLDYLKANNVYDNTRIIIVSDHGRHINLNSPLDSDKAGYTPLLLVKDFNSRGELKSDYSFMTNADTIFFEVDGLDIPATNPFTGKELIPDKSEGINVYPTQGNEYNGEILRDSKAKQFTLNKQHGFHVSDDTEKGTNWIPLSEWF